MTQQLQYRDFDLTYRITKQFGGMYVVSVYSPNHKLGRKLSAGTFREDVLPPWIKEAIALLDFAGLNSYVGGVGEKTQENYWIWNDEEDKLRHGQTTSGLAY